jgi:hypothetical protein
MRTAAATGWRPLCAKSGRSDRPSRGVHHEVNPGGALNIEVPESHGFEDRWGEWGYVDGTALASGREII